MWLSVVSKVCCVICSSGSCGLVSGGACFGVPSPGRHGTAPALIVRYGALLLQQIEKAAAGGAAWVLLQAQPGAAPAAEAQLCSEGSADAPAPPLTPGSGDPLETATTGPLGCHQQQHKQQAAAAGYVSGGGRTYDRQQLRAAAHPCSMMPPEWPRTSCLGAVATTTGSTRSSGASPCTPTAGPADAPVRRHEGQQAQLVMACKVEHAEQVAPGGDGVVVHAA